MQKKPIFLYTTAILTISFFAILLVPNVSYAADNCSNIFQWISDIGNRAGAGAITESSEVFTGIGCALKAGSNTIMTLGMIIGVAMIAWGGFVYITAAGNKDRTTKGINTLQSAILGIAALALVWTALGFILSFIEYDQQVKRFKEIEIKLQPPGTAPAPAATPAP